LDVIAQKREVHGDVINRHHHLHGPSLWLTLLSLTVLYLFQLSLFEPGRWLELTQARKENLSWVGDIKSSREHSVSIQ
jgi:hypothetical protein